MQRAYQNISKLLKENNTITFDISKRKMVEKTLVLTKSKHFDETLTIFKKIEQKFRDDFLSLPNLSNFLMSKLNQGLLFCYQNCSDLLWEKIVLVIEKNFWNLRLKAENLQNFWDHSNSLFKQWNVRTIFGNRMLF